MTVVGKTKAVPQPPADAVPEGHPMASVVPKAISVPTHFTLDRIQVREVFDTKVDRSNLMSNALARMTGKDVPPPTTWLVQSRYLEITWSMVTGTGKQAHRVEVTGQALIDGLTFDADGKPNDPAKWTEAVNFAVKEAQEEAEGRIVALMGYGVEAEDREIRESMAKEGTLENG